MDKDTITMIIAAATLFVTIWMLVYMKKSDRIKDKKRRIEIQSRINSKKEQLEHMKLMSNLSGAFDRSDRQRMEDLESDIDCLENMK